MGAVLRVTYARRGIIVSRRYLRLNDIRIRRISRHVFVCTAL